MFLVYLLQVYFIVLLGFVLYHIGRDPRQELQESVNQGFPGKSLETVTEHELYRVVHVIEDGIERVSYYPKAQRFQTPIVMQHGMWHGAWCWENWQRLLAAHYNADLRIVEADGHNLMMDAHFPQTAEMIHAWLVEKGIT